MELNTVRIMQVSCTFNFEYDRISKTQASYIPRQPTKYTKRCGFYRKPTSVVCTDQNTVSFV
jgi:hypothetical protein